MKYLLLLLIIGGAAYALCREHPDLAPALDPGLDARLELSRTKEQLAQTQKDLEAARAQLAAQTKTDKKQGSWLNQRLDDAGHLLAAQDGDANHGGHGRR